MKRQRPKHMTTSEFQMVMDRNWTPVRLDGNAVPSFLQSLPGGKVRAIYASGISMPPDPNAVKSITLGNHIGGIEVYRNAPDDRVQLNKDLYAVFIDLPNIVGSNPMLLVIGPMKDDEHWIDSIPARLDAAEILLPPPQTTSNS